VCIHKTYTGVNKGSENILGIKVAARTYIYMNFHIYVYVYDYMYAYIYVE